MTLSQGDQFGRYEILDPIGAGGMVEVWRAAAREFRVFRPLIPNEMR